MKQEAEYAAGGGGLAPIAQDAEGAVRELCRGADPKAREKAGELFDTIVLPELQRAGPRSSVRTHHVLRRLESEMIRLLTCRIC